MTPTSHDPFSLILNGEPKPLPLIPAEPSTSPATGRELRHLAFAGLFSLADIDSVVSELKEARSANRVIEATDGSKWRVVNLWTAYDEGVPSVIRVSAEFEENEDFTLDSLEFGELRLQPDKATPHIDGQELGGMEVRFDLDPDANARFEDFLEKRHRDEHSPYFTAQVAGSINGELNIRFGRTLWERLENGSFRHLVTLVLPVGDVPVGGNPILQMLEPARTRLVDHAVAERVRMDALIGILSEAGVLTPEAVDRINQAPIPFEVRRQFERCDNVSNFEV